MDAAEIVVLAGGIAAIVFVLWYFLGKRERVAAEPSFRGVEEVGITVKGGYSPDVILVHQGTPVRLNFYRDETVSCSEKLVLPDFNIVRELPPFETTAIEFTPDRTGEFTFTCGMNMMRGRLIVEKRG